MFQAPAMKLAGSEEESPACFRHVSDQRCCVFEAQAVGLHDTRGDVNHVYGRPGHAAVHEAHDPRENGLRITPKYSYNAA